MLHVEIDEAALTAALIRAKPTREDAGWLRSRQTGQKGSRIAAAGRLRRTMAIKISATRGLDIWRSASHSFRSHTDG
jgi:hypothetical protein